MLAEEAVGFAVALLVAGELALPPVGVGLRAGAVLGAGMPEAAVDVDGDAGGAEDDVGAGAKASDGGAVDAEAEAATVQLGAERQLGLRVAAAELRHLGALRRRRRSRLGTGGPGGHCNMRLAAGIPGLPLLSLQLCRLLEMIAMAESGQVLDVVAFGRGHLRQVICDSDFVMNL